MRRTLVLGLIALAAGMSAGGELWADRLVLKDGTELMTQGGWEVKGRLVLFKLGNGVLSSMRASEIDFEKSAAATDLANTPAPPPPPPVKKASVMSLTEKDLPPVGESDAGAAPGTTAGAPVAPTLTVLPNWRTVNSPDGESTELLGVIRNESSQTALGVQVVAVLIGEGNEVLADIEGSASSRSLKPGDTTSFRVAFESQPFERIEFRITSELAAEPIPAQVEAEDEAPPADGLDTR